MKPVDHDLLHGDFAGKDKPLHKKSPLYKPAPYCTEKPKLQDNARHTFNLKTLQGQNGKTTKWAIGEGYAICHSLALAATL
eukprot:5468251-Amphidinium_carterae.1